MRFLGIEIQIFSKKLVRSFAILYIKYMYIQRFPFTSESESLDTKSERLKFLNTTTYRHILFLASQCV